LTGVYPSGPIERWEDDGGALPSLPADASGGHDHRGHAHPGPREDRRRGREVGLQTERQPDEGRPPETVCGNRSHRESIFPSFRPVCKERRASRRRARARRSMHRPRGRWSASLSCV